DNVMNDQRKVVYEQRAEVMDAESVDEVVSDMRADAINSVVGTFCPPGSYPEQWDVTGLKAKLNDILGIDPPIDDWMQEEAVEPELIEERVVALADEKIAAKIAAADPAIWRQVEKSIMLDRLDYHWKE